MRRFLLVDDEINVLHSLQRALRQHIHIDELRVEIFTDPDEALWRCREVTFDLVISDYRMPHMSGIQFLRELKEISPHTVRMILSASTEFDAVMGAINQAEVFRYIAKPWQIDDLEVDIRLALAHRDQLLEAQRLSDIIHFQNGELTPQEMEAKRLEEDEPGIMKVHWGPNGEVIL
jgi:two-component system probable response regulator PhcQ